MKATCVDNVLKSYRWHQLRVVRFRGAFCSHQVAGQFLSTHPTIEELSVDDCFGMDPEEDEDVPLELHFPKGVLPIAQRLDCCWAHASSMISAASPSLSSTLEHLCGIILRNPEQETAFMLALSNLPKLTRLEVCADGAQSDPTFLRRVGILAPSLQWLVLGERLIKNNLQKARILSHSLITELCSTHLIA